MFNSLMKVKIFAPLLAQIVVVLIWQVPDTAATVQFCRTVAGLIKESHTLLSRAGEGTHGALVSPICLKYRVMMPGPRP
jgi:hypothetical protein